MFVDFSKFNRNQLTDEQKAFIERLVPWARFIQQQTWSKAQLFKRISTPFGMYTSVVMADVIIQSSWGTHPLSKDLYKHRPANNLALLELIPNWTRGKVKYEGKDYRLFDDWEDFSIQYSDLIVFSGKFNDLLHTAFLENQTQSIGVYRSSLESYNERMNSLIDLYTLTEFDYDASRITNRSRAIS